MRPEPPGLGRMLRDAAKTLGRKPALRFEGRTVTYRELDEASNKVANALAGLGLRRGDRVAIMLPNIPEFVSVFFGIQKLGAVAVPFNTLFKGGEIAHVLNDSGARAIVALTHFAALIQEIREDVPALEFVILTGQRALAFVQPGATAVAHLCVAQSAFESADAACRAIGEAAAGALRDLGAREARYRHQGGLRAGGRKIGGLQVHAHESLYLATAMVFLDALDTDSFFRVIWVPPEVKDKTLEPMVSVREESGNPVEGSAFRDALCARLRDRLGVEFEEGALQRDERFGYEKARALALRRE